MVLGSFKRLFKQDFPQQYQQLVDQLSNSLNNSLESLFTLSQNNISLRDNVNCEVKSFNVIVDKNGNPTSTAQVKMDTPGNVEGVTVLMVTNQTISSGYPTGGVFVSFTSNSNGIVINNITGLTAGNNYLIKLVIYQY